MSFITEIADLITRFGGWVKALFDNAEKLYEKLTDEEKQAADWAYGVIAILNKYADEVPGALEQIGIKYPELSSDVLHGFLDTLITDIKVTVDQTPLTLEQAAYVVTEYLKTLKGQTWEQISQMFGNLLAVMFSPTTPVQKFIGVAEFVYKAIVKPKVN